MGSPLNKLPPEVARELLRHVSPRPLKKGITAATGNDPNAAARLLLQQQQQHQQNKRPGMGWILGGCIIFTGATFSLPYILQQWIGNLNERDGTLTRSQIRRGAFNNSGSTDAGKDPQWDFHKGQYKKDDNYWAIFDGERNNDNVFGSMANAGGAGNDTAKKLRERNEAALKKSEDITGR